MMDAASPFPNVSSILPHTPSFRLSTHSGGIAVPKYILLNNHEQKKHHATIETKGLEHKKTATCYSPEHCDNSSSCSKNKKCAVFRNLYFTQSASR